MIRCMDDLRATLAGLDKTWVWVGQRGVDAAIVSSFVPLSAIFCCDLGPTLAGRYVKPERFFSAEAALGYRENWGNRHLEQLWESESFDAIDDYLASNVRPVETICYRSLRVLEEEPRCRVLAPPLELKNHFDDKTRQLDLFARLGLATVESQAMLLSGVSYERVAHRFGAHMVVQAPTGSSGETTRFVRSRGDWVQMRTENPDWERVKVAAYRRLPSLNTHGVVVKTSEGLRCLAASPSLQIVGVGSCTDREAIYCGNDFGASAQVSTQAREAALLWTQRVGEEMGRSGFLGVFGMDFLLDGDDIFALEINPRFQGSTALLTALQVERGEIPLVALQVLQHSGLIDRVPTDSLDLLEEAWSIPYEGAHLVLHATEADPGLFQHELTAGVYRLLGDRLTRAREGDSVAELCSANEWVVLDNLPLPDITVIPGARTAMVQTRAQVLAEDLMSLNAPATAFAQALRAAMVLNPLQGDLNVPISV